MSTIAEAAETAWHRSPTGDTSTAAARHAWRALRTLEEVAPRTWFYSGFANVVVRKTDDGLIVIDPGAFNNAPEKQAAVREQFPVSDVSNRVNTIVYTHGHVDHCFGAPLYVAEAEEHGAPAPVVVGHEVIARRFARYRETIGFNGIINLRQFRGGQGTPFWPDEYSPPTVTYRDRMTLVGGTFSIRGGSINTTGGAGVNAQQSQGPVVIDGVSISTETGLGASFNGFRGDVLVSGSTVRGQPNPGPRGQVTFDGTSSIYTLPSDFFGTDGFTYTIENGTLSDLETGAIIAAGGAGGDRQAPGWTCRSSGARSAARAPDWTSRASLALSVALSETRSSPTTPLAST